MAQGDQPKMGDSQQPDSNFLSIDQEEFSRMQTQLLQLREENYLLREDVARKEAEIVSFQFQSKELEKARKVIQKSKKGKDIQSLVEENESLQMKMEAQEHEFKLQNKTIMDELAMVVTAKDELEKEVSQLRLLSSSRDNSQHDNEDQVLKLKAEIAVLQRQFEGDHSMGGMESDGDTGWQLQAAVEEKRLLYEQLAELKGAHQDELEKVKIENVELIEKLRRKQESVLQLQQEKETLFIGKKHAGEEAMKVYEGQIEMLTRQITELQTKIDNSEQDNSQDYSKELSTLRSNLEKQCEENADLRLQISNGTKEREDLSVEVGELKGHISSLMTKVADAEELADKRRVIINELSTKEHEKDQHYRSKLLEVEDRWKKDNEEMRVGLKSAMESVNHLKKENEMLHSGLKVKEELENKCSYLTRQLEEEQSQWIGEKEHLMNAEKISKEKLEEEIMKLRSELESERESCKRLTDQSKEFDQLLKDKDQEVVIVERKGINQMKDLKRQLQQLQKKEERLQHQLAESRTGSIGDNTLLSPSTEQRRQHSRESSYSSTKGILPESSGQSLPDSTSSESTSLDSDTQDLLTRITSLQSEKWALEARVNHLEQSNAAFAEDLLQKSAVIQHYFMANKADHSEPLKEPSSSSENLSGATSVVVSPRKLIQRIAGSRSNEVDHLKEVVGKLQRALEEALMKNIHLQESMDNMSKEMEALKEKEKLTSPAQLQCASDP